MYLNEECETPAYVLGRVFAILEKKQQDAAGGKLNSTIRDKFFATACANPARAFPQLLKLTQHHKPQKKDGSQSFYLDSMLQNCLSMIKGEGFPKTQNMDEQGTFILGYYQQNAKLWEKKEKREDE